MNHNPETLALRQTLELCQGHVEALTDALSDIKLRAINAASYANLSKEDLRLLDQFAYRFTRLQDDMGARLMPAILKALGEDVAVMPALDRLARLEQLGWLPSADEWAGLRHIRNEFAHDYPDTAEQRFERLQAAVSAATQMTFILTHMSAKVHQRFGVPL
jgi:hypothetical protein